MLLVLTAAAVVLAVAVAVLLAHAEPSAPEGTGAGALPSGDALDHESGRCVLCNSPLHRAPTLQARLAEVERRIDADATVAAPPPPFHHEASGPA